MKKIVSMMFLSIGLLGTIGSTVYAYQTLDGGRLFYNGYQTGSYVVSEIGDRNYSDKNKFKVEAFVYVGNTRYTSNWKNDYAYKSAKRVWYANETSRYNWVRR